MPTDATAAQPDEIQLRIALAEDLEAVHEVFVAASAAPGHPPETRTPDEVHDWVDSLLDTPGELWLASRNDELLGFFLLRGSWLSLLFVHPDRPARGAGGALIDLVKALRPRGFGLRVYQANTRAREFYGRHGLVELEGTDGSSYHDGAPDLQMAWLGEDPLAYLRGRIDAVDDELAVLLARRVALTAAVQDQKEVGGQAGRDPDREAEIVDRMARHVPGLRKERIAAVMHTVIAQSLAAWEESATAQGPDASALRRAHGLSATRVAQWRFPARGRFMDNEEQQLYARVIDKIGPTVPAFENYGYPNQIELALIDSVLSIRANYGSSATTGVRGAVGRYKDQLRRGSQCNDLRTLASIDSSDLGPVLDNRQRSSGRTKVDLIFEVAERLVAAGVTEAAHLDPDNESQRQAWCGVHGLADVTWAYFGMLLGRPGVKADRMIRRFVGDAVNREVSAHEAARLVTSVAGRLHGDTSHLDHAIWRYQRKSGAQVDET